jgi:hypothetical protein
MLMLWLSRIFYKVLYVRLPRTGSCITLMDTKLCDTISEA